MKYAAAALASFVALTAAVPQAVTQALSPPGTPICSPNYSGTFQIGVVNASTSTGKLAKRQSGALILTLSGGVLKDSIGRTGYIAANQQFQFDNPPQAGAIWTAGFSICSNSTLALASTIFFECLSGGFYNLYDKPGQSLCSAVYLEVIPTSGSSGVAPVSQIGDGQPQASTAVAPVTQIGDGQPQVPTSVAPVTQIGDGQPQAPTAVPSTAPPAVTQIGHGQIQAPTTTKIIIPPISYTNHTHMHAPTNGTTPPPFPGAAVAVAADGKSLLGLALAAGAAIAGGLLL